MNLSTAPAKRDFWPLLIFAVAVVLRLIALFELLDAPSFETLVLDARSYDQRARQLLAGAPEADLFWQPVLYPCFLAIVYAVSGGSVLLARLLQACIGGLTAWATCRLGTLYFGRTTGRIAGLIVAGWAPLMLYELDLVSDGIATIWTPVLLLLLAKAATANNWRSPVALGVGAALGVLTRPTYLFFVVLGWLWQVARTPGAQRRRLALGAMAGWALIWLPAAGASLKLSYRFNPLPFSGGLNLYIGNNPDPCTTLNVRPGRDWKELETEPVRAGAVLPKERDAYFQERVKDYALSEPISFGTGLLSKTIRFVNSRELPRNEDPYSFRSHSRLLAVGMWKVGGWGFPFGLLLPLAILGAWVRRREVPALLWLFLATYAANVILVFVSSRYRLAWIPAAALLAALGGEVLWTHARRRAWPALVGSIAGVVLLAFAFSRPAEFCEEGVNFDAEILRLVGHAQWSDRRFEAAEESLLRSRGLELSAETSDYLARVYLDTGRPLEALEMLREAVALNPNSAEILNNLGLLLGMRGEYAEAERVFAEALALDPANEAIQRNLALTQRRLKQLDRHDNNESVSGTASERRAVESRAAP